MKAGVSMTKVFRRRWDQGFLEVRRAVPSRQRGSFGAGRPAGVRAGVGVALGMAGWPSAGTHLCLPTPAFTSWDDSCVCPLP